MCRSTQRAHLEKNRGPTRQCGTVPHRNQADSAENPVCLPPTPCDAYQRVSPPPSGPHFHHKRLEIMASVSAMSSTLRVAGLGRASAPRVGGVSLARPMVKPGMRTVHVVEPVKPVQQVRRRPRGGKMPFPRPNNPGGTTHALDHSPRYRAASLLGAFYNFRFRAPAAPGGVRRWTCEGGAFAEDPFPPRSRRGCSRASQCPFTHS